MYPRFAWLFILVSAGLFGAAGPGDSFAAGRAELSLRGRITDVGYSPNLLAPGPQPGTFVLGDLRYGWVSVRRSADAGVLRSVYVGRSTLGLASSPVTQELYAANVLGSSVMVLDLRRDGMLVDSVIVGQTANLVAASTDGRFVLATAYEPSLVSIFDRNFDFSRRTLVLDDRPAGLVVTRNRFPTRAYVVGHERGKLFALDFNPSSFSVVDTLLMRPGASFIRLSPDESTAYVSADDRVLVVRLDAGLVEREIPVGGEPLGLDVSPDGRFVIVANSASNSISLIDTQRLIVVDEITAGLGPTDVLFVSGSRAYVTLQGENALAVVNILR
jgi:YVTN family beta-propeller protein